MYQKIAQTYLWALFHKIGLAPYIKKMYWEWKIWSTPDMITNTINGYNAKFVINDRDDFVRVDSLAQEENILHQFLDSILSDDIIFDIGANIGVYSCFAARKANNGHVVAFEPEPTNVNRLRENLKKNSSNWSIQDIALSNTDGNTALSISEFPGQHTIDDSGDLTITQHRAETLIETGDVMVPDIVKIDVEGSELNVLEGFGDFLPEVKTVFCEVHPDKLLEFGSTPKDVEIHLNNCGFDIKIIHTDRSEYHLIATKTD